MALGALAGAALGGAAGGIASGLFGMNAAGTAYKRQKHFYKHRHQWEVEDLRKAGLNPILSATKGMTGGIPSVQKAETPDFGKSNLAGSQINLNNAQADYWSARAVKEELTKPVYETGGDIIKQTVDKIKGAMTNSGKNVLEPLSQTIENTAPRSSAKEVLDKKYSTDRAIARIVKYLSKGKVVPIATTYTPRSAAYQKAFAKVKKLVKGKSYKERKKAYDYFNKKWKSKK